MICRHGNEICDECAKLLSVAEAVQFRADNPGTTQQEAAEMAGTTREAIAMAEKREAVTKRNELRNVTDPFDAPYYDVEWEGLNPSNDEVAAWVATWRSWRPASRLQAKSIIFNTPINSAP